jgi:septal ring factor EnvC (AmiA/AmiB activator)
LRRQGSDERRDADLNPGVAARQRRVTGWITAPWLVAPLAFALCATAVMAQAPAVDPARRVGDRIKALQQEAERLATESRTVLVELQQLEVERDLRTEQAKQAEEAVAAAQQDVQATSARIASLEQLRESQLPDLRAQLVDLYKRRHTGYARLLFSAGNLRDFARASRAIAALSSVNEKRLEQHQATLRALQHQRELQTTRTRELQTLQAQATRARAAAQRAVQARSALLARIDTQRD